MQQDKDHVFLVWHDHDLPDGSDSTKLVGGYASREEAEAALKRAEVLPGFCDAKDGFRIERYVLGTDNWFSGFFTSHVPLGTPLDVVKENEAQGVTFTLSVSRDSAESCVVLRGSSQAVNFISDFMLAVDRANAGILIGPGEMGTNLFRDGSLGLRVELEEES